MPDRYFENSYQDYQGEQYLTGWNQLIPEVSSKLISSIEQKLNCLESNLHRIDLTDASVYTGSAGIALFYIHLSKHYEERKQSLLLKAKDWIDRALQNSASLDDVSTFLCGLPGSLAIAAVIYHRLGNMNKSNEAITKILSMKNVALHRSTPNEYLYGRAGYLYTLIFIRRELGNDHIPDTFITEIFESIIRSGERYARDRRSSSPLMYQWHRTEYLGAAHGVSGIVYLLLKVVHENPSLVHLRSYVDSHLIPTVQYLKSRRLSNGNYMSANDSESGKLVQWCHGAPGFVYVFNQAYQVTGDSTYLNLAISAGEIIWERGLLKKGFGLCHGSSGNAYTLLNLYRTTNDTKWFHRALQFARFSIETSDNCLSQQPDCPYSMFEGLAGTIYFLVDLLRPNTAHFPGFE